MRPCHPGQLRADRVRIARQHLGADRHDEGEGFIGCRRGGALLDQAREGNAALQPWVFLRDKPARRFYESHGFTLLEITDGSGNEEHEPDARYRWIKSRR
jgi:hypothetical protein